MVSHGGFAEENTIDEAGIEHQLISGDDMEAAKALVTIAETPNMAVKHRRVLIDAAQKCTGKIHLSVLPIGPEHYDPNWSRSEVILAWLSDSVRKAGESEERFQARDETLWLCRDAIKNKSGPIRPEVAYECAVRCILYYPLPCIAVDDCPNSFFEVLEEAVDCTCNQSFPDCIDDSSPPINLMCGGTGVLEVSK